MNLMCVAPADALPLLQPHAGRHFVLVPSLGMPALSRSLAAVADAVPSKDVPKFAWMVLTLSSLPIMDCSAGQTYLSMLEQTSRC